MRLRAIILGGALGLAAAHAADEPTAARIDYEARLAAAVAELSALHAQIDRERGPLAAEVQRLERLIAAREESIRERELSAAQFDNRREAADAELKALRQQKAYAEVQSDLLSKELVSSLRPGEGAVVPVSDTPDIVAALRNGVTRLQTLLDGEVAETEAYLPHDGSLARVRYRALGGQVYFVTTDGRQAGVLQQRAGAPIPAGVAVTGWDAKEAAETLAGAGAWPVDASGGRALSLQQTRGSLVAHVAKGGVVGLSILALGAGALVFTILKAGQLRGLRMDEPSRFEPLIAAVAAAPTEVITRRASGLRPATRELVAEGMARLDSGREVLEEHLFAFILRQRQLHESKLGFLAMAAGMAPLLGLLGTVTGMVRTFDLISVFGTGQAGRLAGGISEALVTTELGLVVAIPVLMAHGWLSHLSRRNLALVEGYATRFVAQAEVRAQRYSSPEFPA
ncbi:hypothetical protein ESB00_11080 [Oleiharenicola lentus]|uniref:MotA/TolQ/ExbB proton channel domain-containing protein n=1 Tax=Oleiharenicola lentus TaxID=2508720 RepID=A0A4Q1CBU6_9BACT|nr:MotA/TolQ/ExbB proton channel family protein [Oleiharenicola lentus]RXK56382.1 hypothetical protein ESB00_11080 [Oleiharenicola lentus]